MLNADEGAAAKFYSPQKMGEAFEEHFMHFGTHVEGFGGHSLFPQGPVEPFGQIFWLPPKVAAHFERLFELNSEAAAARCQLL